MVSWHDHTPPTGIHGGFGEAAVEPSLLLRFLRERSPRARPVEPRVRVGEPSRLPALEARAAS